MPITIQSKVKGFVILSQPWFDQDQFIDRGLNHEQLRQ